MTDKMTKKNNTNLLLTLSFNKFKKSHQNLKFIQKTTVFQIGIEILIMKMEFRNDRNLETISKESKLW